VTIIVDDLNNGAYGFPTRGAARRVRPTALACLHITGNSATASANDLHAAAQGERNYANRAGSGGPSATHYVARDGYTIEALLWQRYCAWSQGAVLSPNTANPGITRVLALRAKGYNANEAYWLSIENVGSGSSYPITDAQKQADAELIVAASSFAGLPVNRETVHGHWEIDSVNRSSCPDPHHEAFLVDVIARANALLPKEADVSFAIPTVPSTLALAAGDRLYTTSAVSDADPNLITIGAPPPLPRVLPLLGSYPSGIHVVAYAGLALYTKPGHGTVAPIPPAPPPDCDAAVKAGVTAALDKVRANALAGAATAIETAVAGARP
jgi:hypothetical protein